MTLLGDVVDMTFGFAFKSSDFTDRSTDIRLIRGDNIVQGNLRWNGVRRLPAEKLQEFVKYQLAAGDVVVAMDRPWIGAGLKYSVIRESDVPSLLVQRVARLRAREALDQGFLGCVIGSRAFTDHVIGVQTGSAVPHISGKQIGEFVIPRLPPIEDQRCIADTLRALDDKIESNRRAIDIAGELLDAESAALGDLLDTVPLAEVVTSLKVFVDPTTYGDARVDHFSLPAFDAGTQPERVPASVVMSGKLAILRPCVLVSRLNPRFNRTWWAEPEEGVPALASTEFACLGSDTRADLAAIWLAVRDEYFRLELVQRAGGTSGSHQRIRPDDMLTIQVPDVRQLNERTKNAALGILDVIQNRRAQSARLAHLRDTLLPGLLSGRVRIAPAAETVDEATA